MTIRYTESLEGITSDKLAGFFVGWPNPPTPETHLKILQRSSQVVLAVDAGSRKVIGFVNAISDGVLSAYIPLLEVLPEYQGRGIGQELMRRILRSFDKLYMVDLTCDVRLQEYYGKFGLQRSTGMMIRNFARQSGAR